MGRAAARRTPAAKEDSAEGAFDFALDFGPNVS